MPKFRSVSQYNTFTRCGWKYKLSRVDKVWSRPASWLSQGLGVHAAMEAWEKSKRELSPEEVHKIYEDEFIKSVADQAEETPNFDYWFGSGPYSGPVDIERRFELGHTQLEGLMAYCVRNPQEKIWVTPDGHLAVELEFFEEMGGVMVKGFIDQIIETPSGLRVRDIKTGAKPGDVFQLAAYSEAMRLKYGVEINTGDYLMGKTGKPTKPVPITSEDRKEVHEKFKWLEEQIQNERFEPNPSRSICAMCDVKTSCQYAEG